MQTYFLCLAIAVVFLVTFAVVYQLRQTSEILLNATKTFVFFQKTERR